MTRGWPPSDGHPFPTARGGAVLRGKVEAEGRWCRWPWSRAWLPSPAGLCSMGLLVVNPAFSLVELVLPEQEREGTGQLLGWAGL